MARKKPEDWSPEAKERRERFLDALRYLRKTQTEIVEETALTYTGLNRWMHNGDDGYDRRHPGRLTTRMVAGELGVPEDALKPGGWSLWRVPPEDGVCEWTTQP